MIFNIHDFIKNYYGIYAIRNCLDERFYIGSTIDFYKRYNDHLRLLRKGTHANKHLQAFSNKYGIDKLSFELLFLCKNTCLVYNEKIWIDMLNPKFNMRKIIQRPYFEDVEKFNFENMRRKINEIDEKLKRQLEEHYIKYPRIPELNYKEEQDYYFGIPPFCLFPQVIETKKLSHWDSLIRKLRNENKK